MYYVYSINSSLGEVVSLYTGFIFDHKNICVSSCFNFVRFAHSVADSKRFVSPADIGFIFISFYSSPKSLSHKTAHCQLFIKLLLCELTYTKWFDILFGSSSIIFWYHNEKTRHNRNSEKCTDCSKIIFNHHLITCYFQWWYMLG